jgi:hypothetical protein
LYRTKKLLSAQGSDLSTKSSGYEDATAASFAPERLCTFGGLVHLWRVDADVVDPFSRARLTYLRD